MALDALMTIDGERVPASTWTAVTNPARLDEVVGRFAEATEYDVDRAVQAADAALPAWRRLRPTERAAMLADASATVAGRAEEWANLLTAENGKILPESVIDFAATSALFGSWVGREGWLHDITGRDGAIRRTIRRAPIGVAAVIVPWNYPPGIAALPVSTALFAGCTVVLKAPEFSPLALLESYAAIAAKLPPGVLNVLSGTGAVAGRALVRHPQVHKVSFTGSSATGKSVMADAAGTLTRLTLELGGNDAALVLEDADLSDKTIDRIVTASYMDAGQVCTAIKRLYVHESRYDELVEKVRAQLDNFVVGDGMRPEVTMGPLQNSRQYDKVSTLLEDSTRQLDVVQLGSYAADTNVENGYFHLPHLVLDPPDTAPIVRVEQMGPILPVLKFRNDAEAVARANDSEYGLTSSVWSANEDHAFDVAAVLEAGRTSINGHGPLAADPETALGGTKESGMGYSGHERGLDAYLQLHTISNTYIG